jgi:GNAT superfamily N-acetyltransferase
MSTIAYRRAVPNDYAAVVAVDDDACALDASVGLVFAFDDGHPYAIAERARWADAIASGDVEVAVAGGAVVGFAACALADGEPYLDQLSVRCAWMRRGIGARLLTGAIAWAAPHPSGRLWLTTYAHLPWNRPFYARHGFVVCEETACGPELRGKLAREREALPAPEQRVAMVRSRTAAPVRGDQAG